MAPAIEHSPEPAYVRGEMEVGGQRSTYLFFNSLVHWCATVIAAVVAFLVMWLCGHAPFLASAFVGVVILAAGVWYNRRGGH